MKILLVCMGNICRSPMAHGVLEHLLAESGSSPDLIVDSAGTHGYHLGNPPDPRAQAATLAHGIDISGQRCRQVERADFERFDLVLAMDKQNLAHLRYVCPPHSRDRLALFLAVGGGKAKEVPDPYFGDEDGFEPVYQLIREGAEALVAHLTQAPTQADPRQRRL